MHITVMYFGILAELTHRSEEEFKLSDPTVAKLMAKITKQYPVLKAQKFKVAVNQMIVTENTVITEDAEVALLPPFAGG